MRNIPFRNFEALSGYDPGSVIFLLLSISGNRKYSKEFLTKKVLILISLVFLVGCSASADLENALVTSSAVEQQLEERNSRIADLELQIEDLTGELADLEAENTALESASEEGKAESGVYLCEEQIETMKYGSPSTAIAVLEGWFALQPWVQELQGTYSTTFWNDVNSRVHTIRYIDARDGLSTTSNFLIMVEEVDWRQGVLWMTEQCWLDSPHQ